MAKVYRKHRYHGTKFIIRQAGRWLLTISCPLAFVMTAVSIIIPWFLPLAAPGKVILVGLAVALGAGAFLWNKRAVKIAGTMDIIAAGHDGEGAVAKILARLPRDWAVLNNLALRVNGPIVQIDHMVITPVAVHILETKSQKGQIIAAPDSGKWQVKRRGETRSIVNPVQQNRSQVRACRELLAKLGSNLPCHGLVVMTEAMTQTDWPITRATELAQYLDRFTQKGTEVLTKKQIRQLAKALLQYQVQGRAPWEKTSQPWQAFARMVILPLALYIAGLILLLLR